MPECLLRRSTGIILAQLSQSRNHWHRVVIAVNRTLFAIDAPGPEVTVVAHRIIGGTGGLLSLAGRPGATYGLARAESRRMMTT